MARAALIFCLLAVLFTSSAEKAPTESQHMLLSQVAAENSDKVCHYFMKKRCCRPDKYCKKWGCFKFMCKLCCK